MTVVLSGVYPEMLEGWGTGKSMTDVLSAEQIGWLTDREAPGRGDFL